MGLEDGGGGLAELPLCGGGHMTCTEQEDTSSPLVGLRILSSETRHKSERAVVIYSLVDDLWAQAHVVPKFPPNALGFGLGKWVTIFF